MTTTADISTVELSRTRLQLRDDLLFIPQQYGTETFYHVEVRNTSEYFRIGFSEYVFVSLLDGRTSFAEALAVSSQKLKACALSQHQAMVVYSWLLDNGLAAFAGDDAAASGSLPGTRANGRSLQSAKRWNPLWLRIPLGKPEPLLKALNPLGGWIFSPSAAIPALIPMLAAVFVLWTRWEHFSSGSVSVIDRDNWLWLLVAWIGLKIIHELAHGLVCLRYGGSIRETGIILAIFTPMAYVDASSSWSFASRWQRIHTAAAGIYLELLVAAGAVLIWSRCDSPLITQLLQSIIVMASFSTLVFNLNPLMRFDGYYILSDLLQIPNLASQASSVLRSVCRRLLLGDSGGEPTVSGSRRWMLLTYGTASLMWKLLVSVSLLIAASVLFHGAGLALSVVGVVCWFGRPLGKLLTFVLQLRVQHPERLLRAVLVTSVAFMLTISALLGLPSPVMTTAPGIVDYSEGEIVRATTAGFIETVHVLDGDAVVAGDLLLTLKNDEVASEYSGLRKKLAQELLRLQSAAKEHDSGAANIAQGSIDALNKQLAECQRQMDGLQLRAGRNGRIAGRELEDLIGTYAKAGTELLAIGMENEKELQLSIRQADLSASLQLLGQPLRIRIGTRPVVTGILDHVKPQATRAVPHPALAAIHGGPLAVMEEDADDRNSADSSMRLTEHRFTAIVKLSAEDAEQLSCGERAFASLGLRQACLGLHLWRSGCHWFEQRLTDLQAPN